MSLVERFQAYAAAFEETYVDDEWARLEPFFTEDAVYTSDDEPFAFNAEGRDALFAQLRNSVNGFDRQFATRALEVLSGPEERGNDVTLTWAVTYSVPDAPAVRMTGSETATFEGDRIKRLVDTFDAEAVQAVGAWMSQHGAKLQGS